MSTGDTDARRNWKAYIAPIFCITAVLLLLFAICGGRDSGTPERGEDAADIPVENLAQNESSELDEQTQHVVESISSGEIDEVEQSSSEVFLDDLDQLSLSQNETGGVVAVAWTERDALPAVAERVLGPYRDAGSVKLVSAGYVDMKGRVWAALLQGGSEWIDVVAVSTEDDMVSEVRVARLTGEGDAG